MLTARRSALAVMAIASGGLAACGGGGGASGAPLVPAAVPPSIMVQPTSVNVVTGTSATFSVTATGPSLTYQWRKNGADISGATGNSYTTSAATAGDNGTQYSVVVSNGNANVTSASVQLMLSLSADQQAYESEILAPNAGSYSLGWNLNYSGAEINGTNYAYSDFAQLTLSPLMNGPQTFVESAPQNLASTLAPGAPGAGRILSNGAILVVPGTGEAVTVSYVGTQIRTDTLAADNSTVAYSTMRSNYQSVALSGALSATPADFAHWFNSFFSNPQILNANASWGAGAGYVEFTETSVGDRYEAFDCHAATTGANVSACATGTTIAALLGPGYASSSDGTTYHLTDGVVSTVGGLSVWVANAQRPQSATLSTTVEYRIYFQLNGNVYTGALIKDGTTIGGSYYVSNPGATTTIDRLTFLPFQIRMNKAARDSIAAAMQI